MKVRINRSMMIDVIKEMSRRLIEDIQHGEFDTIEIAEDEEFIKISVTSKVMGCAFLFAAQAKAFAIEEATSK